MDFKKFGNFNWIEMDSKDQNLDLTRTKRIHFCPLQSISIHFCLLGKKPETFTAYEIAHSFETTRNTTVEGVRINTST